MRFRWRLLGSSRPNSQRVKSSLRSLKFERLEDRQMFSATIIGVAAGSAYVVAAGGSSSSSAATTMSVNYYDLDLALQAGLQHLQGLLNKDNGNLPYFTAWALTTQQAKSYGDPSTGRASQAHLGFDHHFVSNVAGRSLYALLAGAEAFGLEVDPNVLNALSSTVLKSLHKPRNGNWNDVSPGNQMVTGLAADPRTNGTQKFDMTYLFNMGAGMRGALALATLSDDPDAQLPGYNWSGEQLFEIAVHNLRAYYVYGGSNIGGTRTYNWEAFRRQLGLSGGDSYTGNINSEIKGNWTNLWKGWVDPFLVQDLVDHYEATGYQESLELAKELRDYVFNQRFPTNPSQQLIRSFSHSFEIMGEMNAYSRLALVTGDTAMMERVRARYEALRGVGFTSTGWVPEYFNANSDVGEVNSTVELAETALNFAQFGWTEYYNDVEQFVRGGILPAQLLDTRMVVTNSKPTNDGQRDIANRIYGAFGFPAPYGMVATKGPSKTGGYFADITAGAVAGLAEVKNAAYSYAGGVHQVNLLFDQSNGAISIVTPYSGASQFSITAKAAGDLRVRIPEWADRNALTAGFDSQGISFRFEGDYVRVINPQIGAAINFTLPLTERTTVDVVNGRQIPVVWRGDGVAAMSRMGTPMPFFPDIAAPITSLPANPAPNPIPSLPAPLLANAGSDVSLGFGQTLQLQGVAALSGSSTIPSASSYTVAWTLDTGPGPVFFGDASKLSTMASFSKAGEYVVRLTLTSATSTSIDTLVVTVAPQESANTSPGESVAAFFQQGVNGYGGMQDTTIQADRYLPKGSSAAPQNPLVLKSDGATMAAALMSWDVSSIPVGSVILSASIQVVVIDSTRNDYEIYAMQRAWNEATASWTGPFAGGQWERVGALGTRDHSFNEIGVMSPRGTGAYNVTLNDSGRAIVQSWVDNPSSNMGILVQDYAAKDALAFHSSEAANVELRPKLLVVYRPPAGSSAGSETPTGPFVVYAGSDLAASKSTDVVLSGTIAGSNVPQNLQYKWTLTTGPAAVLYSNDNTPATTVRFNTAGVYMLRLTAWNDDYLAFDELTVTVS